MRSQYLNITNMKGLYKYVIAISIAIASLSCTKEHETEYVYAKFGFSGEVTIEPLDTKSSSTESFESGDLLVLNVYRYKDDSFNGFQSLASVQGGVYTEVDDIVIPLIKGGYYQIIANVIKGAASSASWMDFPSDRNKLIDDKVVQLFSMSLNGKYISNYKSYRGGQRLTANSDVELNLLMVKNYYGITLDYDDVNGDVYVSGKFAGNGSSGEIDTYAIAHSGETILMKFSENCNTGTSDNGRCNTFEEQSITTGSGAMYDPDYLRGFDISIARSLNGTVSYLNVINVEVKAGDNVIIKIEDADFTGYSGELSLNFSDNSDMNDIYYN